MNESLNFTIIAYKPSSTTYDGPFPFTHEGDMKIHCCDNLEKAAVLYSEYLYYNQYPEGAEYEMTILVDGVTLEEFKSNPLSNKASYDVVNELFEQIKLSAKEKSIIRREEENIRIRDADNKRKALIQQVHENKMREMKDNEAKRQALIK